MLRFSDGALFLINDLGPFKVQPKNIPLTPRSKSWWVKIMYLAITPTNASGVAVLLMKMQSSTGLVALDRPTAGQIKPLRSCS
jgi:hypothetical protein